MCEEKELNPKGTGGELVMKMIDDANNMMVVSFFKISRLKNSPHVLSYSLIR